MSEDCNPKLSIVVTSRNDNHGGSLLKRMQIFINGLLYLTNKYQLKTEIIIVEWNPPENAPRLYDVLNWPEIHEYCTIRFIKVPNEIHSFFREPEKLPLHQMIGKNVGIYRARGEYILVTNIDILFSEPLFQYIAANLSKGIIYRTCRFDVNKDIPLDQTVETQLNYCHNNVIRVFTKFDTFDPKTPPKHLIEDDFESYLLYDLTYRHPHINACGDFQLMAREHWMSLRGYPEFDFFPAHVDSLLQFQSIYHGLEEIVLHDDNMCIYHIDHRGSWSPETEDDIRNRFHKTNIPSLTLEQAYDLAFLFCYEKENLGSFNNQYWGLNDVELEEFRKKSGSNEFTWICPEKIRDDLRSEQILSCDSEKWLNQLDQLPYIKLLLGRKTFPDWIRYMMPGKGKQKVETSYEDKKLIAFGTASTYQSYVKPVLEHFKVAPDYFVDNDPQKHNTMFEGKPVYPVTRLLDEDYDHLLILIVPRPSYYKPIKDQLESLNLEEGIHFARGWNSTLYWNLRRDF